MAIYVLKSKTIHTINCIKDKLKTVEIIKKLNCKDRCLSKAKII